jgi:hypothetical protein
VLAVGVGIGLALRRNGAEPATAEVAAEPEAAALPPQDPGAADAADSAAPVVPALDQDPEPASHITAQGVATLTLPPTHARISREPDGLLVHATARHPVRSLRLVIVDEGAQSRSHMERMARYALDELQGQLGPPGTVRRGVQDGLDATFTGQELGAPVHGRLQVLPLGPATTAVVYGWGPRVAAAHSGELRAVFRSLAWSPNLEQAPAAPAACTPPAPTRRPVAVAPAGVVQRVQALEGCVVVLELWAADCPVCRAPHTAAQTQVETLRDEGLTMVQLALDPSPAPLEQHLSRNRLLGEALLLEPTDRDQLPPTLARIGVDWPGTRPWFAVFDRRGRLVHQSAEPPPEVVLRRVL